MYSRSFAKRQFLGPGQATERSGSSNRKKNGYKPFGQKINVKPTEVVLE